LLWKFSLIINTWMIYFDFWSLLLLLWMPKETGQQFKNGMGLMLPFWCL